MWRKDTKKWQAKIKVNYETIYLGCYKKLEDAVRAREDYYTNELKPKWSALS
jgi:hypothetical protein